MSLSDKLDEGKTEMKKLVCPKVPPLQAPHYADISIVFADSHHTYHSLSHCLRTNIFPGAPSQWSTLVKDSYISYPLPPAPTDPQKWYGRKTDDMVRWTERNIVNQRLKKALMAMEKKSGGS